MKVYERRVSVSVILSTIGMLRLLFRIEFNFVCISESSAKGGRKTYRTGGVMQRPFGRRVLRMWIFPTYRQASDL